MLLCPKPVVFAAVPQLLLDGVQYRMLEDFEARLWPMSNTFCISSGLLEASQKRLQSHSRRFGARKPLLNVSTNSGSSPALASAAPATPAAWIPPKAPPPIAAPWHQEKRLPALTTPIDACQAAAAELAAGPAAVNPIAPSTGTAKNDRTETVAPTAWRPVSTGWALA